MSHETSEVITVVANCHCLPLADAFAMSTHGVTTDFIDVNFLAQQHMAIKTQNLFRQSGGVIFSQPLSEKFGVLATSNLRDKMDGHFFTFTNLYFSGLHPDITYIGNMGSRFTGAFGDYHSKIILFSFVEGLSEIDCLNLFSDKFYETVRYYDVYEASAKELTERDAECDIKFASEFLDIIKKKPSIYTVNHFSGHIFQRLSLRLAQYVGIDFVELPDQFLQNHLSRNYIWPVYKEIAVKHGCQYVGSEIFTCSESRISRSLSLEQFVQVTYAAYRSADQSLLKCEVGKMPFFAQFKSAMTDKFGD